MSLNSAGDGGESREGIEGQPPASMTQTALASLQALPPRPPADRQQHPPACTLVEPRRRSSTWRPRSWWPLQVGAAGRVRGGAAVGRGGVEWQAVHACSMQGQAPACRGKRQRAPAGRAGRAPLDEGVGRLGQQQAAQQQNHGRHGRQACVCGRQRGGAGRSAEAAARGGGGRRQCRQAARHTAHRQSVSRRAPSERRHPASQSCSTANGGRGSIGQSSATGRAFQAAGGAAARHATHARAAQRAGLQRCHWGGGTPPHSSLLICTP